MGNFSQCIQQQPTRSDYTPTPLPTTSADNLLPSSHRTRRRNFRSYPSQDLNTLIDETLLVIRTVADADQEPPRAMLVVSRIANREDRWAEVMSTLIERIPMNDPLGATVIALLLEECSLPPKELLQQLIKRICSSNRSRLKTLEAIVDEHIQQMISVQNSKEVGDRVVSSSGGRHVGRVADINKEDDIDINDTAPSETNPIVNGQTAKEKSNKKPSLFASFRLPRPTSSSSTTVSSFYPPTIDDDLHRQRNTLVVLGCLAEKLVGPTSASMLETTAREFLLDRVFLGMYGYEKWKSLDADDATEFSLKYLSVLKIILFALIALEKFAHTSESKHKLLQALTITNEQPQKNLLEYYELWASSANCLKRQIGFFAQWLLDNVFILNYRRSTYETIDHRFINVMLNDKDVSEYLKIAPDGLEARSDTVSFESVRCTFHVNSGVWYYEVLIVTDGVMQIGWATKQSKFMNHEGYGIGDDQHSVAYDGCRNLIWFGAKSIPQTHPLWKAGDIVGCLIDFDRREVIFSLNGCPLQPFRKLFSSTTNAITDGYFAAASFMSFQQCRFNFGSSAFRYPPNHVQSFKSFNDYGHLTDTDKLILPKHKKLEILRSTKVSELDCILCVDLRADTVLKPCQHTGFCEQCAYKIDTCPICRSNIRERIVLTNN